MSNKPANKIAVVHTTQKGKDMITIHGKPDVEDVKLTEHFSLFELCKTNHKEYQTMNLQYGKSIQGRLESLADFLEKVRAICDTPLQITSAVRCPELNKAVGGVPTSQHQSGHAADFIPKGKGTIQDHFCKIYNSNLIYDQLILECSGGKIWIHISQNSMLGRKEALVFDGKRYKKYTG